MHKEIVFSTYYFQFEISAVYFQIKIPWIAKKGAPGLEPGTSWSAGKCSTAELYPLTHIRTMTSYKYQRISYATSVPQNMYYVCTEHCNVLVVCAAAQRTPYCNVDTLLPLQLAPAVLA